MNTFEYINSNELSRSHDFNTSEANEYIRDLLNDGGIDQVREEINQNDILTFLTQEVENKGIPLTENDLIEWGLYGYITARPSNIIFFNYEQANHTREGEAGYIKLEDVQLEGWTYEALELLKHSGDLEDPENVIPKFIEENKLNLDDVDDVNPYGFLYNKTVKGETTTQDLNALIEYYDQGDQDDTVKFFPTKVINEYVEEYGHDLNQINELGDYLVRQAFDHITRVKNKVLKKKVFKNLI